MLYFIFQENLAKEDLEQQFELVREKTNTSHVQEYGDLVGFESHIKSLDSASLLTGSYVGGEDSGILLNCSLK